MKNNSVSQHFEDSIGVLMKASLFFGYLSFVTVACFYSSRILDEE